MIPLKLTLKNFVSYGPQTQIIDFEPYSLVCLSGKNGHGKSALLDAFTWALWGQARKCTSIGKADEGLLRLGQSHMMVCLDFISNGITYRVRREYTCAPKAYSNLEFGILEPVSETLRPLTDKTIRATQQVINTLVGLDYDSFINSAFLRQGQSNEFSKKSPKDRKEILAAILGLDHYEQLRKRAHEHAKEAAIQKEYTRKALERLQTELAPQAQVQDQLTSIKQQYTQTSEQESRLKHDLIAVQHQLAQLQEQKQKYDTAFFAYGQLQGTIASKKQRFSELVTQSRQLLHNSSKLTNYSQLITQRATLQEQLSTLHDQSRKHFELKELYVRYREQEQGHLHTLERSFTQTLEQHKATVQQLQQQLHVLLTAQAHLGKTIAGVQRERDTVQDHIQLCALKRDQLQHVYHTFGVQQLQVEKRKSAYQRWVARGNWLTTELKQVQHKKACMTNSQTPCCPVCSQTLDSTVKYSLTQKMHIQELAFIHQLERLTSVLKKLKQHIIDQQSQLDTLAREQDAHKILTVQHDEYVKQQSKLVTQYEQLSVQLTDLEHQINEHTERLKTAQAALEQYQATYQQLIVQDTVYKQLQGQRETCEQELGLLAHDPEHERLLNQRLHELHQQHEQYTQLHTQLAFHQERKVVITQENREIKQLRFKAAQLLQDVAQAHELATQHNALIEHQELLNQELATCTQQKEKLIHQKGSLEQQHALLERYQQEYVQYMQEYTLAEQTAYEYQALAQAFSKDGIQALLIDDTLPDIEQEANYILARLTDNQAQITIESLRDLRSGGTKETLDIKISDSIGIRPYELFSGGEAFRIDFALRIALSKLLARRAGTALQTLIIDEGFGSQDEEGLSHIMEALYAIQGDFAKIIIVSHLPSMKDQFPVHFYIHKGPNGSMVKVIEQG